MKSLLYKLISKLPADHINNGDYMERYWLIKPSKFFPFSVRFHVIKAPDKDPHLHDHPWKFFTMVLEGGYWEKRLTDHTIFQYHGFLSWYTLEPWESHKIIDLDPVKNYAITLFVMWPQIQNWGFLTDKGKIDRKDYFGTKLR